MGSDPQSVGTNRRIEDLRPVFMLLEKPELAELYHRLEEGPATIPGILSTLGVGKTAAYKYVVLLQKAGLVVRTGARDGSALYVATDFEVKVTVGDQTVTITPEVVRLLAERDSNPEIDRFVEQNGVAVLSKFVELAHRYANGEMTHRAMAEILDVSRAAAFDMLEEALPILDIVPEAEHSRPGDRSDEKVETIIEYARPSE